MQNWAEDTWRRVAQKLEQSAALAKKQDLIPYKGENGVWVGSPFDQNGWWTGGFWPGLMYTLYSATGKACFMDEARRTEALLVKELMRFEPLCHDLGFMYLLSCGANERLTNDKKARVNTLHAANLLAGRFNPAGFIRAWNGDKYGWAIVDCMMNLPLLYWASRETGDPRFEKIARIHADATLREFVRENGSCEHIVIFDPDTGEALDKPGGQGYEKGSSWSRGQAWGLYGFALSALWTGETKYLDASRRIADYFISHIRADGLTDSDFCQPEGEERIDNIAGACAASGLIELSRLTGEGKYLDAAVVLLKALDALCADYTNACPGILQKCTASYHDDGAGRHVNIVYGDYFYMEALLKLCRKDARLWMPKGEKA